MRARVGNSKILWPPRHNVFGVPVSATDYSGALAAILSAARQGKSALIDHMPVHGLMEAASDPAFRSMIERFEIVAPDGQPVRWALNRLHHTGLTDRVYGPELMLRLCERAANEGLGIYLYGSTDLVLDRLQSNLMDRWPRLWISGRSSPPFRPLTPAEDRAVVKRINESGAAIVFLGLGCPKQEIFAYQHRDEIDAVQICVGAAFDFHAGTKRMAPRWMQDRGLEWLFRMKTEPRRLWRRYLSTNTRFLLYMAVSLMKKSRAGVDEDETRNITT